LVEEKRNEELEQDPDTYANEVFLDALSDLGGIAGTQAIAEQIGCDPDTACRHLTELKEKELVRYEAGGGSSWWVLLNTEHEWLLI